MKRFSVGSVTAALLVLGLILSIAPTYANPTPGKWQGSPLEDEALVQLVARQILSQMDDFQRVRRTGLGARQGALSNYLKAKALSATIKNPFGPGKRR